MMSSIKIPTFIILFQTLCFIPCAFPQNWSEPVNISNMEGTDSQPDFTIDQNGVIHSVWVHKYNIFFWKVFYSNSIDNGITWSQPEDISLNDTLWLSSPNIVSDSENRLYVSYDYDVYNPGKTLVLLKTFDGTSWSGADTVSNDLSGSYHNILLIDNNNRLYYFWSYGGKYYYKYMDNNSWSNHIIPYNNDDYHYFGSCALDPDNNLHWIGTHHYSGQTVYDNRAIYFYYDCENDEWGDFVEFGEFHTGSGFDIDIDATGMPHLTWQGFTNNNIPPNDGTFYTFFNGIEWILPELIVEDPQGHQIEIDEYNQPNIFDVEKTESGSMLVHYYKTDENWQGIIIDESDWSTMNPKTLNYSNKLYVAYVKSIQDNNGEVFFSQSDIVTKIRARNINKLKVELFPNPFNQQLTIKIMNDPSESLKINIYNLYGQLIYSLIPETNNSVQSIIWAGKDKYGKKAESGLYLVRVQAGRYVMTRSVKFCN